MTPEESARLSYLQNYFGSQGGGLGAEAPTAPTQPEESGDGFWMRFGKGLANETLAIPHNVDQMIGVGLLGISDPSPAPTYFDLQEAQNWKQKAADIGTGIASTVAQSYMIGAPVGTVARTLGAGARTASILGDVASGAYLGAQHSPEESGLQATEFGGMGAVNALLPGGGTKRLLRGVLNAGIPIAGDAVRGQDPFSKETLINAGAMGLMGAAFNSKNPNERPLLNKVDDAVVDPAVQREQLALPGPTVAPEARTWNQLPEGTTVRQPGERGFTVGTGTEPVIEGQFQRVANDGGQPLQLNAPERRLMLDEGTPLAVRQQAAKEAVINSRTLGESIAGRDLVTFNGLRGKLEAADDGIYFRKVGSQEKQRVYGLEPEAKIGDVEGLAVERMKKVPAAAEDVSFDRTQTVPRDRLRFGSERGSVDPVVLQQIAGTLAGGATGYANAKEDEKLQGTLIGALGGAILPGATRQLLRTVKNPAAAIAEARKQRILPESMKKVFPKTEAKLEQAARNEASGKSTPLGKFARFMERDVIGSGDDVMRAKEVSEGFQNLSAQTAKEAISKLKTFHKTATAKERAAVEAFFNDKAVGGTWSPAAEAKLRAEVGNANAEQFMAMRDVQQKLQAEIGKAIPEKDPMIQATMGTHTSNSFRAFTDPKQWTKDLAANPKISADAVDHMMTQPQFKNWEREAVEIALGEYKADVLRKSKGEIFTPSAGSAKVESTLFTKRKSLPNEFRALLGEIKDPFERQALTIAKLVKSAAKAKAINEFAALRDASGVKMTFKPDEFNAALAKAKASGDAAMLKKLSSYQQIPDATMFGKVGGSFAPREVIDALNAHNEALRAGGEGFLAGLNTFLKKSLTSRNPASHIHQWMQIAPQALILRVYNPKTLLDAAKALYKKGDVFRELVRVGAVGADFSSAELGRGVKNLDQMFGGPKGVLGRLRQADDIASKAFGVPDNIVRAAGYLANKGRFLEQGIKDGLTGAALQKYAEDATMKFVNRYSINFNHVPNVVKWARNVPGITPFVSFSSQMAGILKNLGEDVIHGSAKDKAWALANLAQLGALPLMASAIMEGQLSEKDREEWLKAQKLSPDYAKSQIRVPLGREKNGAFRYMSLNSFTPAGDFVSMARNLARGDVHSLVTENPVIGLTKTPLLNLATTLIGGEDPFTKEKVQTAGERTSRVAQALLPPWTPIVGGTGKRMIPAFTPNEEGGLGVENPRTGRRDTPGDWARGVLGLQTSAVQPKQLLRNVKADARDQILEEQTKFRRVMSTNAAQSVKDKAREKFIMRRKEIMDETKKKLQ